MGRGAVQRAGAEGELCRREPRPGAALRELRGGCQWVRRGAERHCAAHFCDAPLRDRRGERDSGAECDNREPRERGGDGGAGGCRRLGAAGRALHAELPDRALGRGVDAEPGDGARGGAGDREPEGLDGAPGQSVVCASGRRGGRGARRGVVWSAGVERVVADHGGAGPVGRGAGDGRLQSIRLWVCAARRGKAGDAGFLRWVCEERAGRGFASAAPL